MRGLKLKRFSIVVSQCQTCMGDFNPTKQQGPEEEPLNNHTLNPPVIRQIQCYISHTHTHTQHVDGGLKPADTKLTKLSEVCAWPGQDQPHGQGFKQSGTDQSV